MKEKKKKIIDPIILNKSLIGVIAIVAFILIYIINRIYPIYLDDWDYTYIYWRPEKVGGIIDAIYSQTIHYVKWGGRSVVHIILQTLLSWGPFWSDLFNSLAFVALIGVIYLITNLGNKTQSGVFFMIIMLMWFFQADIGETMIWLTGSVNYMWGMLIVLSFILPFYKYFTQVLKNKPKPENRDTAFRRFGFFSFGIIAGWTNENIMIAMICMYVCFLTYIYIRDRGIEKWAVWGFIGACIGGVCMIVAPGNYIRYNSELKEQGLTRADLGFDFYWGRFQALLSDYIHYLSVLFIIYIALLLLFRSITDDKHKNLTIICSLIFLGASMISSLAMIASPVFAPRAWFGIITMFIIAVAILYANIDFSRIYIFAVNTLLIGTLGILFTITYIEGKIELAHLRKIIDGREASLEKQKTEGKKRIVFGGERFEVRENRRLDLIFPKMYDFPKDTTHWMYKAYERYYGVNAVRFENEYPIKREK